MTPTLRDIALDLNRLAGDQGWTRTTQFVQTLLDPARPRSVAMLSLLDADLAGLAAWAQAACAGDRFVTAGPGTDELALADRLLIAFPCGGLPTADVLEALAYGPFARAAATVAVVLTGAEQIDTPEDLALVETTTRRWLLPPEKRDNPDGALAAAGGYLWADAAVADPALASRLRQDSEALARWLKQPPSPAVADRLDHDRVAFALELGDSERSAGRDDSSVRAQRGTSEALHDLGALRDRVLGRLRSEAKGLETAIVVALGGLDADLSAGLRPYLARQSIPVHDSGPAIVELLARYCQETVARWGSQPQEADRQWQKALGELAWFVREFDWAPVNRAIGESAYPDRLLRHLHAGPGLSQPASPRIRREPRPGPDFLSAAGMAKVAGMALLGPAAAGLTGFGPVGIALAGAASIATALAHQWQTTRAAALGTAEECGRQMTSEIVTEFRARFTGLVDGITGSLRSALAAEFDAAQTALEAAVPSSTGRAAGDPAPSDALAALRTRLASISRDAEPGAEPSRFLNQVDS
jgi:hypothetical protein